MHVIEFLDTLPFAGTESHVFDLSAALLAEGVSVTIACPRQSALWSRATDARIPVTHIAAEKFPGLTTITTLAAELRAGRVDIIHAHNGRTHLLAVAAMKRAGRGSVVATQHFLAPNRTGRRGPKAWLATRLHRWAEHNTAAFIAISQAVRDAMLTRHDAPQDKITVVHNGIRDADPVVKKTEENGSQTRPHSSASSLLPSDFSLTSDQRLLVNEKRRNVFCAARLQKEKDIPTLIKAFALLQQQQKKTEARSQKTDAGLAAENATNNPQIYTDEHRSTRATDETKEKPASAALQSFFSSSRRQTVGCDAVALPALLIAGEGDQRPEIEKLIELLFAGMKKAEDDLATENATNNPQINTDDHRLTTANEKKARGQKTEIGLDTENTANNPQINTDLHRLTGANEKKAKGQKTEDGLATENATNNPQIDTDEHRLTTANEKKARGQKTEIGLDTENTANNPQIDTDSHRLTKSQPEKNLAPSTLHLEENGSEALQKHLTIDHCSLPIKKPPVRLLGFRRDIPALMSACDIFVLPAPAEPFGLVLLEAMAMGKPVIAANAGGPCEIVVHGQTGLLFEPGNPQSLAAAIADLLNNPEKARAMGAAGRQRFEEHFTASRMAAQVAAIYAAVATRKHKEPGI